MGPLLSPDVHYLLRHVPHQPRRIYPLDCTNLCLQMLSRPDVEPLDYMKAGRREGGGVFLPGTAKGQMGWDDKSGFRFLLRLSKPLLHEDEHLKGKMVLLETRGHSSRGWSSATSSCYHVYIDLQALVGELPASVIL